MRERAALYVRLSDEDVDKQYKWDESESIQNQKSMLIQYAADQQWDIFKIYCDEDYSGADRNQPRPEFEQMIQDAKESKFSIVLCKSQSRFSREMEMIERYVHTLFPEWGIRFVSVVDCADTMVRGNKKARQINGLINEWFLEDLSENVRMTLRHKKENGQFTGAFAPFGYQKDLKDKNHLVVDEPAAEIVRLIFRRFSEGASYRAIADELNEGHVPNPLSYKRQHGVALSLPGMSLTSQLWSRDTIRAMLRREVYHGTLVQGRSETVSYKNSRKRQIPKERWIRVEKAHEAVIDDALWENVQARLSSRSRAQKHDGSIHIFSQKVFCGICGGRFYKSISNGYEYLRCRSVNIDRCICGNYHRLRLDALERCVLQQCNAVVSERIDREFLLAGIRKMGREPIRGKEALQWKRQRLTAVQTERRQVYRDKLDGLISVEEFREFHDELLQEEELLQDKLSREAGQERDFLTEAIGWVDEGGLLPKLTRQIVEELIEKIVIEEADEDSKTRLVRIVWRF